MTAVSTLDQLDWATCLDQEPGCGYPDCERVAAWRFVAQCGCQTLECHPCHEDFVEYIARAISPSMMCTRCAEWMYRPFGKWYPL